VSKHLSDYGIRLSTSILAMLPFVLITRFDSEILELVCKQVLSFEDAPG
jgi:hypothetical protein